MTNGHHDQTAETAISKADRDALIDKLAHKTIDDIKFMAGKNGFDINCKIVLTSRRTGTKYIRGAVKE